MNVKKCREGYTVRLERGKGKENCFIYHLKNKLPKESLFNLVNHQEKPIKNISERSIIPIIKKRNGKKY